MSRQDSGTPVMMADIEAPATVLRRISPSEWTKAVARSADGDIEAAESHLQDFIAKHPSVLPFDSFSSVYHPSVCIGREVRTKAGKIDCLFISGQSRVTIVETKLHKNPEARREVVAQLLDYCNCLQTQFSLKDLEEAGRLFSRKYFPEHEYRDLWTFVSWSLRNNESSPESDDVGDHVMEKRRFEEQAENSLRRGEILGLIVGDDIDRRAFSLAEFATKNPGSALEVGLVEMAFYRPRDKRTPLVVVPHVVQNMIPVERIVVDVRVKPSGEAQVEGVERLKENASVTAGTGTPQVASRMDFLALIQREAPAALDVMKRLLDRMQQVTEASNSCFEMDFGMVTANLYWLVDDRRIRFLALNSRDGGRLVFVSDYLRKYGYKTVADDIDTYARDSKAVAENRKHGGRNYIRAASADVSLVDGTAKILAAEAGKQKERAG